jgi:hypothetical protein
LKPHFQVDGVPRPLDWQSIPTDVWTYLYLNSTVSLQGVPLTLMGCKPAFCEPPPSFAPTATRTPTDAPTSLSPTSVSPTSVSPTTHSPTAAPTLSTPTGHTMRRLLHVHTPRVGGLAGEVSEVALWRQPATTVVSPFQPY